MIPTIKKYLVFKKGELGLLKNNGEYIFIEENTLKDILKTQLHLIEKKDNNIYYALEIKSEAALSPSIEWLPLRQACHLLDQKYFPILSKSAQIILWDQQHQFCGICGSKTRGQENTWEKHCITCKAIFYPRISPSIIVLIKKEDKILMARSPHFPSGVYGLIAGFVEPGETLEEAVHREVFEEVGIKIKNIRYYDSQSWPFPNTLMIGFLADYDRGEIKMQESEIEAAGWYTKDNLPGYPSSSFSIVCAMINAFVAGELPMDV